VKYSYSTNCISQGEFEAASDDEAYHEIRNHCPINGIEFPIGLWRIENGSTIMLFHDIVDGFWGDFIAKRNCQGCTLGLLREGGVHYHDYPLKVQGRCACTSVT